MQFFFTFQWTHQRITEGVVIFCGEQMRGECPYYLPLDVMGLFTMSIIGPYIISCFFIGQSAENHTSTILPHLIRFYSAL